MYVEIVTQMYSEKLFQNSLFEECYVNITDVRKKMICYCFSSDGCLQNFLSETNISTLFSSFVSASPIVKFKELQFSTFRISNRHLS